MSAIGLAAAERTEFADLLEGLSPQQWDAPTLCTGWSVRQVVAHTFGYDDLGWTGAIGLLLRNGLSLDRANHAEVARYADDPPEQLLAKARACTRPRGLTAALGGRIALTDALIHQQDIRRPLGLPRTIAADRLRPVLEFARTARPLRAKPRVRGLTLVATDVGWCSGEGPVVEGPAEALIMAMAGRPGIVGELSGDGTAILADRIGVGDHPTG